MIHIFSMKGKTKKTKICTLPDAPFLYIPLLKNYGQSPESLVKVGETVKKYQLIGQDRQTLSAKAHSPVSGKVVEIREHQQTNGISIETIVILNDFLQTEYDHPQPRDNKYTPQQLLRMIDDARIVGEGGAQYPTADKYNTEGKIIETNLHYQWH